MAVGGRGPRVGWGSGGPGGARWFSWRAARWSVAILVVLYAGYRATNLVLQASGLQVRRITVHGNVRLSSGERIVVGAFDGQAAAEDCARELMAALDSVGDWPQIDGRYIRPDAVVSIDVELTAA